MLLATAVCLKHPGFAEEKEWRVMHVHGVHPMGKLTLGTETINGFPQPVMKLPLRNVSDGEHLITGLEIDELVERVIIGPTKFPDAVWEAMVASLSETGVSDPEHRVVISDIPLRT
jgi:hypothetical protein